MARFYIVQNSYQSTSTELYPTSRTSIDIAWQITSLGKFGYRNNRKILWVYIYSEH
ncbi:MAG: hypothetical protein PUP91_31405 [Rhizonema sp. PD37]|nr:hypothetical protein [Rhizonema sp. PD37]